MLSVNVFPFLSRNQVLYTPHPDKIALKNGINKSEFAHFHILRTFLVKIQKSYENNRILVKYQTLNSKSVNLSFKKFSFLVFFFFFFFLQISPGCPRSSLIIRLLYDIGSTCI